MPSSGDRKKDRDRDRDLQLKLRSGQRSLSFFFFDRDRDCDLKIKDRSQPWWPAFPQGRAPALPVYWKSVHFAKCESASRVRINKLTCVTYNSHAFTGLRKSPRVSQSTLTFSLFLSELVLYLTSCFNTHVDPVSTTATTIQEEAASKFYNFDLWQRVRKGLIATIAILFTIIQWQYPTRLRFL